VISETWDLTYTLRKLRKLSYSLTSQSFRTLEMLLTRSANLETVILAHIAEFSETWDLEILLTRSANLENCHTHSHLREFGNLRSYLLAHPSLCETMKSYLLAHSRLCETMKSYLLTHTRLCETVKSNLLTHFSVFANQTSNILNKIWKNLLNVLNKLNVLNILNDLKTIKCLN